MITLCFKYKFIVRLLEFLLEFMSGLQWVGHVLNSLIYSLCLFDLVKLHGSVTMIIVRCTIMITAPRNI